jgi:hypothetical protein
MSVKSCHLDEANPWHDIRGRFPQGGKTQAILYSLNGIIKRLRVIKKGTQTGNKYFAKPNLHYKKLNRDEKGRFRRSLNRQMRQENINEGFASAFATAGTIAGRTLTFLMIIDMLLPLIKKIIEYFREKKSKEGQAASENLYGQVKALRTTKLANKEVPPSYAIESLDETIALLQEELAILLKVGPAFVKFIKVAKHVGVIGTSIAEMAKAYNDIKEAATKLTNLSKKKDDESETAGASAK